MTTATMPEATASRPLSEVVESPRALKALEAAGFKTLGDVATRGLSALVGIKHVGEGTRALIYKALGPVPEPEKPEPEIEEGPQPIRLEGPIAEMRIALLPTHRHVTTGGVTMLDQPLYIEFAGGEAVLTKKAWLTRIYERDSARVAAGMAKADLPWRKDAVEWLRGHATFARGEFRILLD